MKSTICPDCKRIREVKDDVFMAICLCGNTLNFNRNPTLTNELSNSDQVILKDLFSIGVEKGKPETMEEWLDDIDTKIKVNLL